MAKKPMKRAERLEIIYDKKRWKLLKQLRSKTIQIMETLDNCHLRSIVHGSIARGDVSETSDIDVFLPDPPSSFIIETELERSGFQVYQRTIIQATPLYALKGYIELDQQISLSFPLVKLRPVEKDFYRFGGEASLSTLRDDKRVLGVDKRLMLIEPTAEGHVESAVVGREEEVANLLRVSLNTVLDRVRALIRRDEVGRTGVFIEKELAPDETFEQAMKKLAYQNPAVRRRIKFYQK
ncbi:nucleotidyltransferase domain-containing protein [Candidatus Bathyarchaeota archaeon]|nr:nucleotidyltransferase domain-containing protein [Candidatus Bathyarchaeota archaeon]